MNAIEHAWTAFMAAIDEAHDLLGSGADASELAETLQHAREVLGILDEELAAQSIAIPASAGAVLAQLHGRLTRLERQVAPTKH